ncbi:MAG: hypothetical protein WKF40_08540 [Thermoleophilaceae bacterium]
MSRGADRRERLAAAHLYLVTDGAMTESAVTVGARRRRGHGPAARPGSCPMSC